MKTQYYVIESVHGLFWNGNCFGPFEAAQRFTRGEMIEVDSIGGGDTYLDCEYAYFFEVGSEEPFASFVPIKVID